MSNALKPGDRVQTAIGTVGVIQEPPFPMPLHLSGEVRQRFNDVGTATNPRAIYRPASTTKKRRKK